MSEATAPVEEMTNDEFYTKLTEWMTVSKTLALAKEEEMKLRKELFGQAFTAPAEGVNYYDLQGGWKLKGTYKIDRKVEEESIPAVRVALAEIGVSIDPLLNWKPSLATTAYKSLSDATKSVFDQLLTIKPGAPSLELVAPKKKA